MTSLCSEDCFVIINRKKKDFTFPIHTHFEFELNFIEHAKGAKRIVGDSMEEIDDLELCLIGNKRLEHGWVNNNYNFKQIHEITIHFHKDLFLESWLNKKEFQSLAVMFENAKKGIVFSRPTIEKLKNRLNTLSSNQNGFDAVIDLISILYELSIDNRSRILCNCTFTNENNTSESRRVQKVMDYLEANFQKNVRLTEVAEYVGMSNVSLSRFMKKRTGKNYIDYFNDMRLSIVSRYLISTIKPVSEISLECGYNSLSNFNRIFKKRKGCTPQEFRNNYARMRKVI